MAPTMSLEAFVEFWEKSEYVSPYNRELGLQPHSVRSDWCVLKVEYARNLVGDPNTRVLHGGVITALLDAAFGFSIFMKLSQERLMATLDLRIDYLKPATPDKTVLGGAVCYKMTADLAFVRGCAYHESADDPIATAVGIFMFTDGPTLISNEKLAR
ncbi:MAG: PaaI family thioesterase [Betaproteobacteria bacterium]|nr:MAG: PaaI family thioesterase [Betaproteobacteria bacterium]